MSDGTMANSNFLYSNNAQKPDDDFISRFQQTFNDVVPRRDSDEQNANPLNSGALNPMMQGRYADCDPGDLRMHTDANGCHRFMGGNEIKMEDPQQKYPNERTPRNLQDLGFSPSWMDPNSMNMMSLANQHPGFLTPNSGGMGAIFHSQAGDLHTPTAGLNMITPLSLSNPIVNSQTDHQGDHQGLNNFNPQFLPQNMPHMNPFAQQPSFAPSEFMHRDSTYDAMDESGDGSSLNDVAVDSASNLTASTDFSAADAPAPTAMSYAKDEKYVQIFLPFICDCTNTSSASAIMSLCEHRPPWSRIREKSPSPISIKVKRITSQSWTRMLQWLLLSQSDTEHSSAFHSKRKSNE